MSLEAIIASLGELTGDAMCICRDPGPGIPMELVWANSDLVKMTGFSLAEMIGKPASRFHVGAIDPKINADIHNSVTVRGKWRGDLPCVRSDGTKFWADVTIRADLHGAEGETFVLHVYRDIDASRQREEALSARQVALEAAKVMEERLRAAVEAFQGSFALYDPDLNLVLCNTKYKEELTDNLDEIYAGMSMAEATRVGVRSGKMTVLPGLDEDGMVRHIEDAYKTPDVPVETAFKDGRVCLSVRSRSQNGDYIVARTDITEVIEQRRQLQDMNLAMSETLKERESLLEEVKQAKERLSAGMETLPDSFAIYDENDSLIICNQAYASEWSDDPSDVQPGIDFRDLVMMGVSNGKLDPGEMSPDAFVDRYIPDVLSAEDVPIISEFRPGHFVRSLRRRAPNGDLIVLRTDISEVVHQRRVVEEMNEKLTCALREREDLYNQLERVQDRLVNAFEALPDAIAIFDPDGLLVHFNRAYVAELTDNPEEVRAGLSVSDMIRLGFRNGKYDAGHLDEDEFVAHFLEHNHVARAESIVHEHRQGYFVRTVRRGTRSGDLIVLRADISEEIHQRQMLEQMNSQLVDALKEGKAQAQAAQRSEQRLTAAIEAIPDGFAMFDRQNRLIAFNAAYAEIYPVGTIQKGMTTFEIIEMASSNDLFKLSSEEQLDQVLHNWSSSTSMEKMRTSDGRHFEVSRNFSGNRDKIVFRRDVTDLVSKSLALETAQQKMEYQASHDALTGVRNRRGLSEALDAVLAEAKTHCPNHEACVLHVDLDRFKGINDTLGHAAGDFILCHVAEFLRELAGERAVIARVGGDEFVIAFSSSSAERSGLDLANAIVAKAAQPVQFDGKECQIGASVGLATWPQGGQTPADLLVNSDIALYRAKNAGRNQSRLFDATLRREVEAQQKLADAMIAGLRRGEFVPVYQPQFDAHTLDLIGLEALARWRHPQLGILSPATFLDVAEGLGATARIDEAIFEAGLHECENLLNRGVDIPAVSFNVSCDRIRSPDFLKRIRGLKDYPFDIKFELLESIFIEEDAEFLFLLDSFRELGVRFELDDFGSGRASIVALTQIGAHRLKIDQRLVRPIEHSAPARQLIKACIDIGAALEIEVLAEGVETEGQAAVLRDLGCKAFQGYLFAQPMMIEELESFLQSQSWRKARHAS